MDKINTFFNQLPAITDIEYYANENWFFSFWLIISLIFLFFISIAIYSKQLNFFPQISKYLISEQFNYNLFREQTKWTNLETLLALFFVFQFTYLLFQSGFFPIPFIKQDLIISFGIHYGILFGFFILKSILYLTLKPLLPKGTNVFYYGFSILYFCFYSSILLFLYNLIYPQIKIDSNLAIVIVLSFLAIFYIWSIIRFFTISMRYNNLGSLYFYLYLCALELVPLVLLIEWYKTY